MKPGEKITADALPSPIHPAAGETTVPTGEGECGGVAGRPRKPSWIRARIPSGEDYKRIKSLVKEKRLHTVCVEALCPNLGECWGRGTATFLILGDLCTRDCRFCGVRTGTPGKPREEEAEEVADAVSIMGLKHAVITSVTRDDLPDGGAGLFAKTIRAIRLKSPGCVIETLVPDFCGSRDSVAEVLRAGPDIFGHNMETVRRLYSVARPLADYDRSLRLLELAGKLLPSVTVKSGIMVGLGESTEEVLGLMADLFAAGCRVLTIGQYLSPTRSHLPVSRYYTPDEFVDLRRAGMKLGFDWVEAGPLVRSSYHAEEQAGRAMEMRKDAT